MIVDGPNMGPGRTITEKKREHGDDAMKRNIGFWKWIRQVLIAFITATFLSANAMSQSLLSEGLEALFEDASNVDEFGDAWDTLYEIEGELRDERAQLQALNVDGYLVRDTEGRYIAVTPQQIDELGETIATDLLFSDDTYGYTMGLLARGDRGGELEAASARAVLSVIEIVFRRRSADAQLKPEQFLPTLSEALHAFVTEADRANRVKINADLANIDVDLTAIDRFKGPRISGPIEPDPVSVPEPVGFLNDGGYYILQFSGTGWKKGGAGYATKITGYQNFIAWVADDVTEFKQTQWTWHMPPGTDIQAFERFQQSSTREMSESNCRRPPPLGPVSPSPKIWEDGPHFDIVEGPIIDWSEAREKAGNPRLDNLDPQGRTFWEWDGNHNWKDLDPICERYGVSIVD